MATTLKLKNSVTTTVAPSTLSQGEAAVNITDKKVWVGDASSSPVQILGAGAPVSGTTGTFTGNTTIAGTFAANGGTTLGDASGDALTINSSAVSIPNGLNFDSNTLVIDATNNRVGVGNTAPATALQADSTSSGALQDAFTIRNGASTANTEVGIFFNPSSQTTNIRGARISATNDGANSVGLNFYTGAGASITSKMSIDPAGNMGLGVTPSLWINTYKSLDINSTTSLFASSAGSFLGNNLFINSGGSTVYKTTAGASYYGQSNGIHNFLVAGSGTAGNAVTLTEAMRITSAGNVGIGTSSPNYLLSVQANSVQMGMSPQSGIGYLGNYSNAPIGFVVNNSEKMRLDTSGNLGLGVTPSAWETGSFKSIELGKIGTGITGITATGSSAARLYLNSNSYQTLASGWVYANARPAAQLILDDNTFVFKQAASGTAGNAITFTQAMTLDASGNLLVGATSGSGGSEKLNVTSAAANFIVRNYNSNASPYGLYINYSAAAPNGTSNEFLQVSDTGGVRATIRSNGGIANYSANNVNLSDIRTKTDIELAGNYLDKICSIQVKTFKYKDQTDNDLNLGVIAQEVEAVAPELVSNDGFGETPEDGVPLKAIYQTDLVYALMKSIQELKAEVDSLKAQLNK
jgi:hypothetical protein